MIAASIYILRVPPKRREVLLDGDERFGSGPPAEPVNRFKHSRRAPLIVLGEFKTGGVTHIAKGRKGISSGRGLVRLNLEELQALERPITFKQLRTAIPKRFRAALNIRLRDGGLVPPKTVAAVVDALLKHDSSLRHVLGRFSRERAENIARLTANERTNLALQKETLGAALDIAGFDKEATLEWTPTQIKPRTFLDGLPLAYVREDAMLVADFDRVPGFRAMTAASHYATKVFEKSDSNPPVQLTVIMANRQPLEQQTGADLIYYNETFRSFVMVQYKAMDNRSDMGEPEFRWHDGDKLSEEIARMDALLRRMRRVAADIEPDGYRMTNNPFFLKFCSRVVFNPDDKGLFPGFYLPLDLWKSLAASGRLTGARGGNLLSYQNVGRRLSGSDFVALVGDSWVGTTIGQSRVLELLIREVLKSGKTLTYAVKRDGDPS